MEKNIQYKERVFLHVFFKNSNIPLFCFVLKKCINFIQVSAEIPLVIDSV